MVGGIFLPPLESYLKPVALYIYVLTLMFSWGATDLLVEAMSFFNDKCAVETPGEARYRAEDHGPYHEHSRMCNLQHKALDM